MYPGTQIATLIMIIIYLIVHDSQLHHLHNHHSLQNHDIDQIHRQACVTDTDCELVSAERGLDYKCFQYMSVLTFVRIVFKNVHLIYFLVSICSSLYSGATPGKAPWRSHLLKLAREGSV